MASEIDLNDRQKILLLSIDAMRRNGLPMDPMSVQKMVFLVTKLMPERLKDYDNDYLPYDFGPYSELVETDVARMQDLGLLNGDLQVDSTFNEMKHEISRKDIELDEIASLVSSFKDFDRDDLVYVVYKLYPDYTVGSKIKSYVRSKKLESMSFDAEGLRKEKKLEIVTDKGRKVKVELVDGRIILSEVGR
ncbi:MAG: hypothetical protein KIS30_04155 [Thermoplasmata archaeon]|nr:hypothetical protein [Candidatus Sysuiplasma acidicola]MBX8645938.1 hypothetical protein [Candidatus Sysuiplasma acidicola]